MDGWIGGRQVAKWVVGWMDGWMSEWIGRWRNGENEWMGE